MNLCRGQMKKEKSKMMIVGYLTLQGNDKQFQRKECSNCGNLLLGPGENQNVEYKILMIKIANANLFDVTCSIYLCENCKCQFDYLYNKSKEKDNLYVSL